MKAAVHIRKEYRWGHFEKDRLQCWYVGAEDAVRELADFLLQNPESSPKGLREELSSLVGNFALIAEDPERIVAAVDKVRSYPVFYVQEADRFSVSNSARALREEHRISAPEELSLLELQMAGYVTGRETLYQELYQLQAGEALTWDKKNDRLDRERYFLFFSERTRSEKEEDLVEELDEITTRVFSRVIREANGAPIWVPLSGGLDSRLVLCKLKQLGYDDLHAFSYGPPRNYEAKIAKKVTEKLGVDWGFYPFRTGKIREFFRSAERREYWRFSAGCSSLPFMTDEFTIRSLLGKGLIKEGCVIINGQSGDFISGGHCYGYHQTIAPGEKGEHGFDSVTSAVVKKHYSLDYRVQSEESLQRVRGKIEGLLAPQSDSLDDEGVVKFYEWWEWQERQSKFVVNGQRSYDFYGLRWALPLWADEYLFFWREVPYPLKFKQTLYKSYLARRDFFGLFREFKPTVWNWQGPSLAVLPLGALLKRVVGPAAAERLYHYASYFGKYHGHYAPFGLWRWVKRAGSVKSPLTFYIETLFSEEGLTREQPCHLS